MIKYLLLKTSCGCVKASISKYDNKDTNNCIDSVLNVFLNTTGKLGKVKEDVIILYSLNGKTNQTTVHIDIDVSPSIQFNNYNKISLYELSRKGETNIISKLYNKDIDIKRTLIKSPEWLKSRLLISLNEMALRVSWDLKYNNFYGVYNDVIVIYPILSNSNKLDPVSVFIEAYRSSPIKSNTNFLYIHRDGFQLVHDSFKINAPAALKILDVTTSIPGIIAILKNDKIYFSGYCNSENRVVNGMVYIWFKFPNSNKQCRHIIPFLVI